MNKFNYDEDRRVNGSNVVFVLLFIQVALLSTFPEHSCRWFLADSNWLRPKKTVDQNLLINSANQAQLH